MLERFSLGAVIRQRRIELGWTQDELAERISTNGEYVRQSEISRIENGRVALPRRERLLRLAEVLELPAGELLACSGWAGANVLLQENGSSRTPEQHGQPVQREGAEPLTNDAAGRDRSVIDRRPGNAADQTAMENLRRALAALHEQTERLTHNRDVAAQILEQVQRPRSEPGMRRFNF